MPGKIRVESDELHYCLHIILRFEFEVALIEGTLPVAELPALWRKTMKSLIGVTPRTDSEGVLQDVHWSGGAFGYFPSYALGSIYAAQLFKTAARKIPELDRDIARGDFRKIKTWLTENVHIHGAKYEAEEVIRKVCGKEPDPEVFIAYLTDKYCELYKC